MSATAFDAALKVDEDSHFKSAKVPSHHDEPRKTTHQTALMVMDSPTFRRSVSAIHLRGKEAPSQTRSISQRRLKSNSQLDNSSLKSPIDWKKKVDIELHVYVRQKFQNNEFDPGKIVSDFLSVAFKTTTAFKKIAEAKIDHPLIKNLSALDHPKSFLSAYKKLKKKERAYVKMIIGGREEKKPLKLLCKKELHLEWIRFVSQEIKQLEIANKFERQIHYETGFDENKISKVWGNDLVDTFRFFHGQKIDPEHWLWKLNGNMLPLPDLGNSEVDKREAFTLWLISTMNAVIDHPSALSAEEQTKLLMTTPIIPQKLEFIEKGLKEIIEKNEIAIDKREEILHQILDGPFPNSFKKWLESNFLRFNDVKLSVSLIIKEYLRDYCLRKYVKAVPCIRILQALSFNAYAPCATKLLQLFPSMMETDPQRPKMKTYSKDFKAFSVTVSQNEEKKFSASQIQQYRFYLEKIEDPFAYLQVEWKVEGHLDSHLMTATLITQNFQLKSTPANEKREQILKMIIPN